MWPLYFVLFLTNWLSDNIVFIRLRFFLASFFFRKCGRNLHLDRNITFYKPYDMKPSDNIYIANGTWLNGEIIIESDVMFGPFSIVASSNHTFIVVNRFYIFFNNLQINNDNTNR